MTKRGKLWIVPNEEEILQESYEKNVDEGKSHTYYIKKFLNLNMIDLEFDESDYQTAPCETAKLGHMVIKSDDDVSIIIFYLPEKITDKQYNWIYKNKEMINKYMQVSAYSLALNLEEGVCWKQLHGLDQIMLECNMKNISNEKGMKK